jgi:hypothetical protein
MNTEGYNLGWDDAVAGNKPAIKKTSSGKFKVSLQANAVIEDEDELQEFAESYLQGYNQANASQAW